MEVTYSLASFKFADENARMRPIGNIYLIQTYDWLLILYDGLQCRKWSHVTSIYGGTASGTLGAMFRIDRCWPLVTKLDFVAIFIHWLQLYEMKQVCKSEPITAIN